MNGSEQSENHHAILITDAIRMIRNEVRRSAEMRSGKAKQLNSTESKSL
jgi:hypothetical protein